MKERPILFSGPMVRAILNGHKTQTRRVVKDIDPVEDLLFASPDGTRARRVCSGAYGPWVTCPYGKPGDRLWVRETFATLDCHHGQTVYRADGEKNFTEMTWKPPIYMPRRGSRITLEIVGLRVDRLQDISDEDAKAEGAPEQRHPHGGSTLPQSYHGYRELWESINGPGSWDKNPWVWVVEFKRIDQGSTALPTRLEVPK